jgi:hypothetical protein
VRRLKQRAASRKYTPAQEAARARAADGLRRQQQAGGSWWGGFADAVQDAWDGLSGAAAGEDYREDAEVRPVLQRSA